MIIIDATDVILGRLAATAAKKALLGEEVRIINAGKAVVTGAKIGVVERYVNMAGRGTSAKGPFIPRVPDRLVKRTIRGMLPYKQTKGSEAYKRIRCYKDAPKEFQDSPKLDLKKHSRQKLTMLNFGRVETICKELGGK